MRGGRKAPGRGHAAPRPDRPRDPKPPAGPARPRHAQTGGSPPAPAQPLPPNLVVLGEFGRPHGLAGELRLKSFTDEPKAVGSYGPLTGSDGRSYVLTHLRQAAGDQPDLLVVRVEGVTSREAAEALTRIRLHVPRETLGQPEEDEFFLTDLVGLAVEGPDGFAGRVVAVPDYGGGELLEIAVEGRRRTELLPFTKAFVPVVDIAGGRLAIAPPEGWLDEPTDEG
ncbi:ribosome maturation factor RimM [Enterovirga rhinocerotis]|uniref:ribosome maturation factor RimM n=1 Tax=Enterovirga rhinocerotis TaxID=1339210 RepID=UPI001AACDD72